MLRDFVPGDAAAAAELSAALLPWQLVSPRSLLHVLEASPSERRRFWTAEEDGKLVGFARAAFSGETAGGWVGVDPARRRRGVGSALWERVEAHAAEGSARKLRSHAGEEPEGQRFLERRGLARTSETRIARLDVDSADLSALDELEAKLADEGCRAVPLRDLLDRARELYELFTAATVDEPLREGVQPYEEWRAAFLGAPHLEADGSLVVLSHGTPVSFAFLSSDRERGLAWNDGTATRPEHRGRGLATLAKLATVRWARTAGIRAIYTGNDAGGDAILAINRRLGYRLDHVRGTYSRDL